MNIEKIDLYLYFGIPRGKATGGYLTAYARAPYTEIGRRFRPAMLVIPGGGYQFVSEREGEPIALQYAAAGFSAFVLNYSVCAEYPTPLVEACMAVSYIRNNAAKYEVVEDKIAAIGFSAGGHLAGLLATRYNKPEIVNILHGITNTAEINALIMSYAVVSLNDDYSNARLRDVLCGQNTQLHNTLSVDKNVTKSAPPAFIWHTATDDVVSCKNSLRLGMVYAAAGVDFALHIYEQGGHGESVCTMEVNDVDYCSLRSVDRWLQDSLQWLRRMGFNVSSLDTRMGLI